jgi:heat shock protein HslJ
MRPPVRFLIATAALAGLVLLAGCSSGGETPSLEGTSWKLTGWSLSSLDPNDFTITADFKDGKVTGQSAVNRYSGSYTTGPGDAFSAKETATTMMAGPEPAMRAEQAYLKLLGEAASFKVSGSTLTLFDASGNESLIYTGS